jgi:hypothetical protein
MSRTADHLPIYTQLSSPALYPDHFTREEAAEKQGVIVQTTVPIFEVPRGTHGIVVHCAKTHDDGYSVAIVWQRAPDRPHEHAPDADTTPSADPIIDWLTKSEYERYVFEITTQSKG